MIANAESELQRTKNETSGDVRKYDKKVNMKRTEIIKIGRSSCDVRITVDEGVFQQAIKIMYLEAYFSKRMFRERCPCTNRNG